MVERVITVNNTTRSF